MSNFPKLRLRRLRRSPNLRKMIQETTLSVNDLIYPIFVRHGRNIKSEIPSMPDIFKLSLDHLIDEVNMVTKLGIPAILLFGIPDTKNSSGTEAYSVNGIVQEAIRVIKKVNPQLVVITDVCLCSYTKDGHCGLTMDGEVDNDQTLELLAKTAVSQTEAGADMVAPSAMMDGQVQAIRTALDANGHINTPIMAYSAKYSSGFYGPFRTAAESAPQFGDRHGYQMDIPNSREAIRAVKQDINEGADIVMIKPALAYLDVITKTRHEFSCPVAAYNVSGEYSMVKAAAENNWLNEQKVTLEILTAIKRAGADMIISYHAKEAAQWLETER